MTWSKWDVFLSVQILQGIWRLKSVELLWDPLDGIGIEDGPSWSRLPKGMTIAPWSIDCRWSIGSFDSRDLFLLWRICSSAGSPPEIHGVLKQQSMFRTYQPLVWQINNYYPLFVQNFISTRPALDLAAWEIFLFFFCCWLVFMMVLCFILKFLDITRVMIIFLYLLTMRLLFLCTSNCGR